MSQISGDVPPLRPEGMVKLGPARFLMGEQRFYPDEGPVHEREIDAFWIDRLPVTNRDFAAFVEATGYVTVAEQTPNPEEFPGAASEILVPGSTVFRRAAGPVDLRDWRHWWEWVPGASWRHPEGPGSSIAERLDHPVVHVAYHDANAYAAWAGKRLPTEPEHEYASRGGRDQEPFAWGDDPYPGGQVLAHTWLGRFPYESLGPYGGTTAPAGSYPANAYGLSDLVGNVWEWTTDIYRNGHLLPAATGVDPGQRRLLAVVNDAVPVLRVLKGGSFLCTPDYCFRFRPAARSPQTEDTGASHIGFRCAMDAEPPRIGEPE